MSLAQPATWPRLAYGHWRLVRFSVFLVLAGDAFLQIRHAPRYGTSLRVAHLPGLDALGATQLSYLGAQLGLSLMFTLIAVGVATPWLLPLATALYGWAYFGSQLDSYQHHYLVWWLLLTACWGRWTPPRQPQGGGTATDTAWGGGTARLWEIQLAIMYGWAVIAKLDSAWWHGATLRAALPITTWAGALMHGSLGAAWTARLVLGIEAALAFALLSPRLRSVAWLLGVSLHLAIAFTGLEIGAFAYLMLALYLILLPAAWYQRLAHAAQHAYTRLGTHVPRWRPRATLVAVGLGGAACALGWFVRVPYAWLMLIAGASAAFTVRRWPPHLGWGVLLTALVWLATDRLGNVGYDYYRFWGSTEARLGTKAAAVPIYQAYEAAFPSDENPPYQLAKVLAARQPADRPAALAALERAQARAPRKARAYLLASELWLRDGQPARARATLERLLRLEPQHAEAQARLARLPQPHAQQP